MNSLLANELREVVANNLYAFYRTFVSSKFDKNVHAPHIKKLAAHLTNIAYNPEANNRICIAMPPQHSKSSMATVAYTAWLICRNPNLRILVINAEAGLSETFGIQIRQLLEEVGPLFNIQLSNVKSSSTHLMFERDGQLCQGEIRLTGATGSITGHPADIVIVDDPYKGIDDITPTLLQKKINWFKLIVEQRIRKTTKLIILHTRWHSNDLQGYLLENDRDAYDWVTFPAIDKDDNILWPEYYDREFYEDKRRRQGDRSFQSLYQQTPIDETGDFFDINKIIFEDITFNKYHVASCRSWDMAYTKVEGGYDKKKDFTVGVPMFKVSDYEYWITDFVYGQFGDDNLNKVKGTARADGPDVPILIETGTKGGPAKQLFDDWEEELTGYMCHQSEPIGTKADRAFKFKYAILDGKIHVAINNNSLRQAFINQIESFPNGEHDDIIDACSYAYNFLSSISDDVYGTGEASYN